MLKCYKTEDQYHEYEHEYMLNIKWFNQMSFFIYIWIQLFWIHGLIGIYEIAK